MLPAGPHVRGAYLDSKGILAMQARRAADRLLDHRRRFRPRGGGGCERPRLPMIDAPVSGGTGGAAAPR